MWCNRWWRLYNFSYHSCGAFYSFVTLIKRWDRSWFFINTNHDVLLLHWVTVLDEALCSDSSWLFTSSMSLREHCSAPGGYLNTTNFSTCGVNNTTSRTCFKCFAKCWMAVSPLWSPADWCQLFYARWLWRNLLLVMFVAFRDVATGGCHIRRRVLDVLGETTSVLEFCGVAT